ncbi:hypothetical protein RHSIM_Rhsim06G0025500 [Rhododendron simsii]|uniref:GAGA-binding transcriptional activator n=1 Tax=Rhododendron simsii TaxID=118357 RepID=A0A834GTM5_RHOSS|nr:hypothetical protein RHSIM_Rhsim06G0025500 [Rhododendron simsii]
MVMEGNKGGYAWAISAGLNAALAAISAKLFSSHLFRYGLVIFFNVVMWGCYVNSLKALSSLQATGTNFATNFLSSGLAGFFLFEESLSIKWFAGALLIVIGVLVLIPANCGSQMDDSGHRENGRHKPPQGQWFMQHQPSMKQIMGIMAERDAAIQERNLAVSEKKTAMAERDMAILQRDSAISERNSAIMERDNAIATLQYRETTMTSGNMSPCPPGCQISRGVKHMHHPQQHNIHHQPHMSDSPYNSREMHASEPLPMSPVPSEPAKPRRTNKRTKEPKATTSNKKPSKSTKRVKREGEDLNKLVFDKSHDWNGEQEMGFSNKPDWKDKDLGLNQVAFDESMPVPVCSCTGVLRPCYKWGNGGWQSSCCTTTISVYPLPAVPNKKHARVGGRKMSGSAFNKLLSRLASEGHDLSHPIDLRDHWAKHGTNRYITIK